MNIIIIIIGIITGTRYAHAHSASRQSRQIIGITAGGDIKRNPNRLHPPPPQPQAAWPNSWEDAGGGGQQGGGGRGQRPEDAGGGERGRSQGRWGRQGKTCHRRYRQRQVEGQVEGEGQVAHHGAAGVRALLLARAASE